jgi:hypothetical protein
MSPHPAAADLQGLQVGVADAMTIAKAGVEADRMPARDASGQSWLASV